MRTQVHDTPIRFRASASIAAAAADKARREGMTISELMRHALRQNLREVA